MAMHHVRAWYPQKTEEGIGSPETGITDIDELLDVGVRIQPGSFVRAAILLTPKPSV